MLLFVVLHYFNYCFVNKTTSASDACLLLLRVAGVLLLHVTYTYLV